MAVHRAKRQLIRAGYEVAVGKTHLVAKGRDIIHSIYIGHDGCVATHHIEGACNHEKGLSN